MSEKTDWFEVVTADASPTPVASPTPGVPKPTVPPDPLPDLSVINYELSILNYPLEPTPFPTPTPGEPTPEPTPEFTDFQIPATGPWGILVLVIILGGLVGRIRRVRR